jgi:hypothetical protein
MEYIRRKVVVSGGDADFLQSTTHARLTVSHQTETEMLDRGAQMPKTLVKALHATELTERLRVIRVIRKQLLDTLPPGTSPIIPLLFHQPRREARPWRVAHDSLVVNGAHLSHSFSVRLYQTNLAPRSVATLLLGYCTDAFRKDLRMTYRILLEGILSTPD